MESVFKNDLKNIQWKILKNFISINRLPSKLVSEVTDIEADDFLDERYKQIFQIASKLRTENIDTGISFEKLYLELEEANCQLSDEEYTKMAFEPDLESYSFLVEQLKHLSLEYKMKKMLQKSIRDIDENGGKRATVLSVSSSIQKELEKIQMRLLKDDNENTTLSVIDELLEEINNPKRDEEDTSIPIPYASLQYYIQGWQKEKMITIGAGTGQGKSVFACNCAYEACRNDKSVLFFSLEMTKKEIIERIASNASMVSMYKFRKNDVSIEDKNKINSAIEELKGYKLDIDDTPGITMDMIEAKALKKAQSKEGLDMIIIDYLQLITSSNKSRSRQEEVAEISRSIKLLAKSLKVPVMVLVQLNTRNKELGDSKTPTKDDIRESGAIAQDSDIVILIHRVFKEDDVDPKATFFLDKHRGGPAGKYIQVRAALDKALFLDPKTLEDFNNYNKKTENDNNFKDVNSFDDLVDTEKKTSDEDIKFEDW